MSFREGGSRTTGGQCGLTAGVEQRPSFASFAHFWSAGLGEVQWGVAHILHHQSGGKEFCKWWKKVSDKKGLTFCDPPPPGHLMWFTSMGGSDISTHLKIGADNSLIRLKLDTCLVTLVAATSLLGVNSIQGHLILAADSTKSRQLK